MTCFGSASFCSACKTGFSNNGACTSKCQDGSYVSGQSCKPCDISCKTCTQTSISCTECAADFIRAGANCIKKCPSGYFYDIANRICTSCGNDCKQCSSLTMCTVCNDPRYTPVDGECKANCPSGATLNGDTCVCNFGLLHLSACVQTCPQGYFATVDRVCTKCSDSCLTCSGSASSC